MPETCCTLLGVLLAFLLPGFFMTLQISLTFLSMSTLTLFGLSGHSSLMSNLAASELNLNHKYISLSHKAIIPDIMPNLHTLSFLQPCNSLSYDVMSHLEVVQFLRILHQSFPLLPQLLWSQDLIPLVNCLHPYHRLLQLCLMWHLCASSTEGQCCLTQALLCLLAVAMALGIPLLDPSWLWADNNHR